MNNSLLDFNFNGDIIFKNFDCSTNSSFDIYENLEDQLKTMLYSLLFYDKELSEKYKGLRITNKEMFESEFNDYVMNKIKNAYPLNTFISTLEMINIFIKETMYCFFYYINPENQTKKILLNYELKI